MYTIQGSLYHCIPQTQCSLFLSCLSDKTGPYTVEMETKPSEMQLCVHLKEPMRNCSTLRAVANMSPELALYHLCSRSRCILLQIDLPKITFKEVMPYNIDEWLCYLIYPSSGWDTCGFALKIFILWLLALAADYVDRWGITFYRWWGDITSLCAPLQTASNMRHFKPAPLQTCAASKSWHFQVLPLPKLAWPA